MEISPIAPLLVNSKFADHAEEIAVAFEQAGVTTLQQLDNAPRKIGPGVAGYSTFQVKAFIRDAAIQRVIEGSNIEPVVEPEPEPVVVELEEEPEPEPAPEPKEDKE